MPFGGVFYHRASELLYLYFCMHCFPSRIPVELFGRPTAQFFQGRAGKVRQTIDLNPNVLFS